MKIKRIWIKWKILGKKISNFLSRVILLIIYFTLIIPFAVVVKLKNKSIVPKNISGSHWSKPDPETHSGIDQY